MRLTIYGDFNCPFSALAGMRAAALERRGLAWIDWRAVEHDTAIPPAGEAVTGARREAFVRELAQIRDLLVNGEADRLRVPDRTVNTRLATSVFASTGEALRPGLREKLFAAYWTRGEDLTDPELLEPFGADHPDDQTARRWRAEWLALAKPIVPTLVLPDGYVSRGLGALTRLAHLADEAPRIIEGRP